MLIPLIFKNDDDLSGAEPKYSKIGKVPPTMQRAINAYSLYNKVGIFKGYGTECKADVTRDTVSGTVTVTFGRGLISVYGGVMLIEDNTILTFTQPSSNTTGYIGVSVDLSKDAGAEADFFVKSVGINTDDLQSNDATGKYDFIMYKYVVDGSGNITLTYYNQVTKTDTPAYIYDMNQLVDELVVNALKNGNLKVKESEKTTKIIYTTTEPTASPEDGTLIIYTGKTLPSNRYDRILYLIY